MRRLLVHNGAEHSALHSTVDGWQSTSQSLLEFSWLNNEGSYRSVVLPVVHYALNLVPVAPGNWLEHIIA